MKKTKILAWALMIVIGATTMAYGDIPQIEGGVYGDLTPKAGVYEYQEVSWLSGEPILMTGTVTVPTTIPTTDKYKVSYTYELENTDESATLSRKITYDVEKLTNEAVGQTTYKMTVNKLDEEVVLGGVTYTIGNYVISKSILEDNTPAVDFYSGSLYTKRLYYRGGTTAKTSTGKVTVESSTDTLVGYKHRWGNSETQIINENISAELKSSTSGSTTSTTENWKGTAQIKMSSVEKERFDYVKTETQTISFKGNYTQVRTRENVLQYNYDMPTVGTTAIDNKVRSKGSKSIKKTAVMSTKPLIAPKLRDITGLWAEKQILLTTSLELFSPESNYFYPNAKVTRKDFFVALTRVLDDIKPLTKAELIKRTRGTGTTPPFPDIELGDPYIVFYEYLKDNGLAIGENEDFQPARPLTRADMIHGVINALGIADMAPQPPYKTVFKDDASIPSFAKDSIYMANEIGIISAYSDGTIKPTQQVTRAEAAAMLVKLLDHIRVTITEDYRDKLINR